ncbi:hypothetical protein BpHYR1_021742 [Brachionus plicatilis]|uniref:Uncharacterized protein n=1 Tax=Brachionus plicatilis TaxID=10195 RepID=A0A3M7SX94_BRAPC|nr:hypothetical protein BpHYR1_021742 [Brachionus plicatilis]
MVLGLKKALLIGLHGMGTSPLINLEKSLYNCNHFFEKPFDDRTFFYLRKYVFDLVITFFRTFFCSKHFAYVCFNLVIVVILREFRRNFTNEEFSQIHQNI